MMGGSDLPQKILAIRLFFEAEDHLIGKEPFCHEQLQVGIIIAENEFNHKGHSHLLMHGKNRIGQTLSGVSMKKWAKEWCAENGGKWIY